MTWYGRMFLFTILTAVSNHPVGGEEEQNTVEKGTRTGRTREGKWVDGRWGKSLGKWECKKDIGFHRKCKSGRQSFRKNEPLSCMTLRKRGLPRRSCGIFCWSKRIFIHVDYSFVNETNDPGRMHAMAHTELTVFVRSSVLFSECEHAKCRSFCRLFVCPFVCSPALSFALSFVRSLVRATVR